MGAACCGPSAAEKEAQQLARYTSKALTAALAESDRSRQNLNQLLFVGPAGGGKSTMRKQMEEEYGKGWSQTDRMERVAAIHANAIADLRCLIAASAVHSPLSDPSLQRIAHFVSEEMKSDEEITSDLAVNMSALWQSDDLQATFRQRSHYPLRSSAQHFLDRLQIIAAEGFVPSDDDIIRCRDAQSGVQELAFKIDGNDFRVSDMPHSAGKLNKWLPCFEQVAGVLFVVDLSSYDRMATDEDGRPINALAKAMDEFDAIVNSRWMRETSMLLMLNKRDLFEEKLKTTPLRDHFPAYVGGCSLVDSADWLQEQFCARNADPDNRRVYAHITCAVDSQNMRLVFGVVKDIVIRRRWAFHGGGFLI